MVQWSIQVRSQSLFRVYKLTLRNGHSLHAIAPYFENGSLKVADIMAGVSAEHAEKALNSLKRLESETQIENLRLDIEDYEEKEKRRKETLERQVLPEIRPIMEVRNISYQKLMARMRVSPNPTLWSVKTVLVLDSPLTI